MKILFRMTFAVALVLVLTATGLWAGGADEEPAAAAEKEMVRDPATGKMVTAPEYGGTLTFGTTFEPKSADAWYDGGFSGSHMTFLVNEKLGIGDWGVDRDVFDWRTSAQPLSVFKRPPG